MDGREFLAVVRLSTKGDATLADVGERCDRVPAASLPWLLAQGLIVPVESGAGARVRPAGPPAAED